MSGVRGPNSALTEFLRLQGISARDIAQRHQRRQQGITDESAENSPSTSRQTSRRTSRANVASAESDDPEIAAIAEAAAAKRRRDKDEAAMEGTAICASCSARFTITVFTRETSNGGVLCRPCGNENAKNEKKKKLGKSNAAGTRKKRKQLAAAILDLKDTSANTLQDLCIDLIANYIDDIDELGDLTDRNFSKIANILTKNRRLNSDTLRLFMRPDAEVLELWDCCNIRPETYELIPELCPKLKRLHLGFCGQLDDKAIGRFARLQHLEQLYLDGPFMVRKDAWMNFFEVVGPQLKRIDIKNVYRVDSEVLAIMADCCTNLEHLGLERLSQMNDSTPIYLLTALTKLQSLSLADLEPNAIDDPALVAVLNAVGSQLTDLAIVGSSLVTDRLIEAIQSSCTDLKSLVLKNLDQVSDAAISEMFVSWHDRGVNMSLSTLNLERTRQVSDQALSAILEHCGPSLVDLNVNSLKLLTDETLVSLSKLPNLTKLDLGFVGVVEPRHVYRFAKSNLKLLMVYGNIRLSGLPLPEGLAVVGTM